MKGRYPLRPLAVPALIGVLAATGLVAALLSNGLLEVAALGLLAFVVGLVVVRLAWRPRG
jgi:hypothetical protein